MPLTGTNTGSRAWDPTKVHISYHWLWIVPRELASRSRTLPYHDGIRTELGDVVPPGRAVTAQTRLLAPSFPGVYWLQWDMVEEGVTWFAQVSPRHARQLVVVLPTLTALVAPLPLLAVVLGLVSCRLVSRGSRSETVVALAALGDVPRPYGAWLDDTHLFVGREVRDRGRSCFALASAAFVDDSGCHAPTGVARHTRDVRRLVVTGDLQQNLKEVLR